MTSLQQYRIELVRHLLLHQIVYVFCYLFKAPPTAFYIPNFITPEEGTSLWDHVS